jgi:uroporphyrinogen-III decarboxylase
MTDQRSASARQRGVPWRLAIPAEVRCEYTGTRQGDYYTDLEAFLHAELAFPDRFWQATGFRPPLALAVPMSAYEGVAALGGGLVFPAEHQPMIQSQGRILPTPESVDALRAPDPWQLPRFQAHVATWRALRDRQPGLDIELGAGQEGPVTTAVLLRGLDFFGDCLLDPPRAHRLLSISTDTFIAFVAAAGRATGAGPGGEVLIADDHAGNLSPALWPEFVLPYYERIYAQLGATRRTMHTELVRPAHLPLLRQLHLDHVNFGEDQHLAVRDVVGALDVPFDWHLRTVADMLQGTPERIHAAYRQAVADGAPEMAAELTVGTPVENIRAFVDVAREHEPPGSEPGP